jgi:di/tricarboxylate transporter
MGKGDVKISVYKHIGLAIILVIIVLIISMFWSHVAGRFAIICSIMIWAVAYKLHRSNKITQIDKELAQIETEKRRIRENIIEKNP